MNSISIGIIRLSVIERSRDPKLGETMATLVFFVVFTSACADLDQRRFETPLRGTLT